MELEIAKAKLANWAEGTEFELMDKVEQEKVLVEVREAIWVVLGELEKDVVHIPLNLLGGGNSEKDYSV